MKAYITCPCSNSQNRLNLLPVIRLILKKNKINSYIFKIGGVPKEIFRRDYKQIKNSDLIIAEVSESSHGVGIEIGMSYCLDLKRILLIQGKKHITKLAIGMPGTIIINYKDEEDLKIKLEKTLHKIIV